MSQFQFQVKSYLVALGVVHPPSEGEYLSSAEQRAFIGECEGRGVSPGVALESLSSPSMLPIDFYNEIIGLAPAQTSDSSEVVDLGQVGEPDVVAAKTSEEVGTTQAEGVEVVAEESLKEEETTPVPSAEVTEVVAEEQSEETVEPTVAEEPVAEVAPKSKSKAKAKAKTSADASPVDEGFEATTGGNTGSTQE